MTGIAQEVKKMTDTNDTKLPEEEKDSGTEMTEETQVDECAELQEKAEQFENKYLRVLADYQNLEKRRLEERIGLLQSANKDLLLKFLPILDTLILAQQHEEHKTLGVLAGQFLDIIKAEGVTSTKTLGEKFDPMMMEVIATQEGKEGIVIQEVRAGYLLHDRLLRPAGVIVGSGQKKEGK